MPDKTDAQRITRLEQQVQDLAEIVGKLSYLVFGDEGKTVPNQDNMLRVDWHFEFDDEPGHEHEEVGWWTFTVPNGRVAGPGEAE